MNSASRYLAGTMAGLLLLVSGCRTPGPDASSQRVATETASRTVEDGGTGPFKALMAADSTLTTHTVFRPKDLGAFGRKAKLPIIAWGNGACANSPWEHVNFLGEKDIAYRNGMDDFRRINHVPVFAANLNVGHGGTYSQPHGGDFAKVATAWFQWQLKGDPRAAAMFEGESCGVARMPGWTVDKKNFRGR